MKPTQTNLSSFLTILFLFHPFYCPITSTNAAIVDPNFWHVTQEELDALIRESAPDLMTAQQLGGIAKNCNELPGYQEEQVYRLTNATVVLIDKALLCADFPSTCRQSKQKVQEWILQQAAWISKPHVDSRLQNIPLSPDETRTARRACQAGRALLLPIKKQQGSPDWIDVKGIGSENPKMHSLVHRIRNANGMLELQNALWEFLNEKTVAAALQHYSSTHDDEHTPFRTIGCYAVLSLGFEIPWETESGIVTYPAGAILRQASRRHPNPYGFMAPKEGAFFEQILNSYGMRRDTTINNDRFLHLPNPKCRRVNVQGTIRSRQVVDFGELYADPVWPPPNGECLVHWGKTSNFLDTPLWRNPDAHGTKRVRDFLREELRELPPIRNETWPAKEMNTVRQHRLWIAAEGWWNGKLSLEKVEEAVYAGLIDELILQDGATVVSSHDTEL